MPRHSSPQDTGLPGRPGPVGWPGDEPDGGGDVGWPGELPRRFRPA